MFVALVLSSPTLHARKRFGVGGADFVDMREKETTSKKKAPPTPNLLRACKVGELKTRATNTTHAVEFV